MVRSLCLAIALIAGSNAAWAQTHTAAEERACSGDAHRFCKEFLADEFRVTSCLQEHREQISRACQAVLDGH
jgi:hypothetical protein